METSQIKEVMTDAVVLSLGFKPDQSLLAKLEATDIPVTVIGSAQKTV
ncbi:MAG TPA: hypothetical protein VHP81_10045 [Lachnospiraceae bacterium]|nr:hypothetical protein [Lachnospiraceae bacterium]